MHGLTLIAQEPAAATERVVEVCAHNRSLPKRGVKADVGPFRLCGDTLRWVEANPDDWELIKAYLKEGTKANTMKWIPTVPKAEQPQEPASDEARMAADAKYAAKMAEYKEKLGPPKRKRDDLVDLNDLIGTMWKIQRIKYGSEEEARVAFDVICVRFMARKKEQAAEAAAAAAAAAAPAAPEVATVAAPAAATASGESSADNDTTVEYSAAAE